MEAIKPFLRQTEYSKEVSFTQHTRGKLHLNSTYKSVLLFKVYHKEQPYEQA